MVTDASQPKVLRPQGSRSGSSSHTYHRTPQRKTDTGTLLGTAGTL
eukprot:COSAG03_NODE_26506_length_258_cov_35.037736_1_plen_45_part_10